MKALRADCNNKRRTSLPQRNYFSKTRVAYRRGSLVSTDMHMINPITHSRVPTLSNVDNASPPDQKPVLSPIQYIPAELMAEIFLLTLPHDWRYRWVTYRRAVMLPGRICQRWRQVVLSSQRHWSSISIMLHDNVKKEVEMTKTWLARSGGCSLFLRLSGIWPMPTHPAIDLILIHSERWRVVEFVAPLSMFDTLHVAQDRIPLLESLVIHARGAFLLRPPLLDAFEFAPQLRSLTIGPGLGPGTLKVPWHQLTECLMSRVGGSFDIDMCLEILRWCPKLVTCELGPCLFQVHSSQTSIIHRHISTLVIRVGIDSEDPGPLFDLLTLPALSDFEYFGENGLWRQRHFIALLSRSTCSLQRLAFTLYDTILSGDDLVKCLELTPGLVELDLEEHSARSMTTAVLAKLSSRVPNNEGMHSLIPKLQVLKLDLWPDFDDAAFAGMLESRRGLDNDIPGSRDGRGIPNIALRSVQLSGLRDCENFNSVTLSRLRNCRDGGLQIQDGGEEIGS